LSARAIHGNFVATLGPGTVRSVPVTRSLHGIAFISAVDESLISPPTRDRDNVDDAILLALANQPFASVRLVSPWTRISRNLVHQRLTISFRFTMRDLR
jgi:hypothetical protein